MPTKKEDRQELPDQNGEINESYGDKNIEVVVDHKDAISNHKEDEWIKNSEHKFTNEKSLIKSPKDVYK